MDKPTFIPQDIWDSAIRSAGGEDFAYPSVVEAIAHSVWEERERCAHVAKRAAHDAIRGATVYHRGMDKEESIMAKWIEYEIRNPAP